MYRRGVRERRQVSSEYYTAVTRREGREGVIRTNSSRVTNKGYENLLASRAAPRGRRGPKGNQSSKVPPAARNDVT